MLVDCCRAARRDRKACRRDELLNLVEEDPELLAVARAQVLFARVFFVMVSETRRNQEEHRSVNRMRPMCLQGLGSGKFELWRRVVVADRVANLSP